MIREYFRRYRRVFWLAGLEIVVLVCLVWVTSYLITQHYNSQFRVVYSLDRRQNDQEIIKVINSAQKYVYFAIYYFTEQGIADALVGAKSRGLIVRGIMDAAASLESNKRVADKLRAAGITLLVQKHQDGIMHIKAVVTDKAYASGSYNWTSAATEANDEVLEIGTDDSVRAQYLGIIKKILKKNE